MVLAFVGMAAASLTTSARQLSLFPAAGDAKQQGLDSAVDRINSKFGKSIIRRGGA